MPIATLQPVVSRSLYRPMPGDFRSALLWHMERAQTKESDLSRGTGISRDIINKLIARDGSSTAAKKAIRIAGYYGLSLEQFIRCEDDRSHRSLTDLIGLLSPDEARMLEAQVLGILGRRSSR